MRKIPESAEKKFRPSRLSFLIVFALSISLFDFIIAPALVIVYKDSTGALKEAKKEFIVTKDGDVPSLVQTGADSNPSDSTVPAGQLSLLLALLIGFGLLRSPRRGRASL